MLLMNVFARLLKLQAKTENITTCKAKHEKIKNIIKNKIKRQISKVTFCNSDEALEQQ